MKYTIVFRKGKIELTLTTDDKTFVERQLSLIISQASNAKKVIQTQSQPQEQDTQYIDEAKSITTTENIHQPVFEHIKEEEKQAVVQIEKEDIIPQTIDIATVKPVTINSIQNPEPVSEPNFDNILNTEMNYSREETPVLKDEKFINYVEGKAALEKIDFLVITAQYLAQYENMNTFNLKHINAKLMQNFTLIVDHSVLQSAIAKEYITRIQEGADEISAEYMLTEKGLRSY